MTVSCPVHTSLAVTPLLTVAVFEDGIFVDVAGECGAGLPERESLRGGRVTLLAISWSLYRGAADL